MKQWKRYFHLPLAIENHQKSKFLQKQPLRHTMSYIQYSITSKCSVTFMYEIYNSCLVLRWTVAKICKFFWEGLNKPQFFLINEMLLRYL